MSYLVLLHLASDKGYIVKIFARSLLAIAFLTSFAFGQADANRGQIVGTVLDAGSASTISVVNFHRESVGVSSRILAV